MGQMFHAPLWMVLNLQLIPKMVMDVMGDLPGLPGLFVATTFGASLRFVGLSFGWLWLCFYLNLVLRIKSGDFCSTISGGLNALAAVFLEDLIKPTYRFLKQKALSTKTSRIVSRIVGKNWTQNRMNHPGRKEHKPKSHIRLCLSPLKTGMKSHTKSSLWLLCSTLTLVLVLVNQLQESSAWSDKHNHKETKKAFIFFLCVSAAVWGLATIGLAFLAPILGNTVIQIALSLFGMIGGPLCGVVTLALFFPCCNATVSSFAWHFFLVDINSNGDSFLLDGKTSSKIFLQGALCGLLASMTLSCWIGFGAVFAKISVPRLALSTATCHPVVDVNTTISTSFAPTNYTVEPDVDR